VKIVRRLYARLVEARADCMTDGCGWFSEARNAHGSGVQHAKAHGHAVQIVVIRNYEYEGSVR
jgi:hypothetical protein